MLSPNDKYAALVAAAGYLPVTLTGEDYLELLPVAWRAVNDYGIQIDYRTYTTPGWAAPAAALRITARRGHWAVHYDPYDLTRAFVRTRHSSGRTAQGSSRAATARRCGLPAPLPWCA